LPAAQTVGRSGLLAGEYSNSTTEVNANWLALTLNIRL